MVVSHDFDLFRFTLPADISGADDVGIECDEEGEGSGSGVGDEVEVDGGGDDDDDATVAVCMPSFASV